MMEKRNRLWSVTVSTTCLQAGRIEVHAIDELEAMTLAINRANANPGIVPWETVARPHDQGPYRTWVQDTRRDIREIPLHDEAYDRAWDKALDTHKERCLACRQAAPGLLSTRCVPLVSGIAFSMLEGKWKG